VTFLLGTLLATTIPSGDPDAAKVGDAYRECVETEAKRMARSKETAPVVAESALTSCAAAREDIEINVLAKSYVQHPEWSIDQRQRVVKRVLDLVDEKVRDLAIFIVTDARSR
jgi:hypothetical protein